MGAHKDELVVSRAIPDDGGTITLEEYRRREGGGRLFKCPNCDTPVSRPRPEVCAECRAEGPKVILTDPHAMAQVGG
jgi:RecJ-like exonuclease